MTKAEMIARYGQEWYDEQAAKNRARAKAAYDAGVRSTAPPEVLRARTKASRLKKHEQYKARERAHAAEVRSTPEGKARQREAGAKHWRKKQDERLANPELHVAYKAERKAYHDVWREANREHVNASSRAWAAANPEYRKTIAIVMAHKRRAAGPIDFAFVAWIKQQACIDCGSQEKIEVGHIVSIKLGGTNDPANLIPQCRSCNRRLSSHPHKAVSLE